jgi:fructose-specific phosphotransferase system IIC component
MVKKKKYYVERPDWEFGIIGGGYGFVIGNLIYLSSSIIGGLISYQIGIGAIIQGLIFGIICFIIFSYIEPKQVEIKERSDD